MEGAYQPEVITEQSNFIIVKLILQKDAILLTHKSKGLTTLIPVKGERILIRNVETIAIRLFMSMDVTPHDEHDLLAKTLLELLNIEVFVK